MDNIKKLVEDIPYLQIPSEKEEEPQEEEVYQHIETDEEIDNSLKSNFQEMLVDEDGQMSLYMQGGRVAEPQVSGQMSIEDVLADWERPSVPQRQPCRKQNRESLNLQKREHFRKRKNFWDALRMSFQCLIPA